MKKTLKMFWEIFQKTEINEAYSWMKDKALDILIIPK